MNIQSAQFAYLSSCHSASSGDIRLLSESINLSSAVQLAGFPSVIGTLWRVDDALSADIATNVYQRMLVDNKLDVGRSAESLHRAALALRDKTRTVPGFAKKVPDNPLVWAPYIHIGV
jgi:CHAT domain-containing protein